MGVMRETTLKSGWTGMPGRREILIFVMSLGLALGPAAHAIQSVTLAWEPSPSSGVAGYMILSGSDGISYDNQTDAGTNTTWTVTGLEEGTTNFFEVAAYDVNYNQSPPSNPVEYDVPEAPQTVAVAANPADAGSVTGGGSFVTGSSVTVTATANTGYTFTNWTENGSVQSAAPSYTFTLAANRNLVANFTANPITNTVAVQANPAQAGSVIGGGSFVTGSSVTVTATANSGYTFTNWTENGSVQSAAPSYTFTLAANRNLVANFTANPITNTVAIQANPPRGGSVKGGGSFAAGSSITVTATTNSGYIFANWMQNGKEQSTAPSYTFTLATNCNLVANFTPKENRSVATQDDPMLCTVTASAGTNGSISPSGPQTVVMGNSVAFTAAPATDYLVQQWLVNGKVAQTGGASYTLQNVTNTNTVVVRFALNPCSRLSLAVSGNGTVTPATLGGGMLTVGKSYSLTASAGRGCVFSNWMSNGIVVAATPQYTFAMSRDLALQASFVTNPFIPVAGIYQGLFYASNSVAPESSGGCNVTVSSNGTFTTKLQLAGQNHTFAGQFSLAGRAAATIARTGASPLTVQLQLGLTDGSLSGQVSGGPWSAELITDPVPYSNANPAPQAGKYTLAIPGVDNSSLQPGGDGYGAATVDAAGNASMSGVLADGTSFTTAAMITGSGQWPFYASLYGGKGSLLGWLAFATNGDISGQLQWIKEAQPTAKYYPAGFTNRTEAAGSVYRYSSNAPVPGFASGQVSLTGGNLPESLTHQIEIGAQDQITDMTANKPAFTLTASSGLLSGSVLDEQTGKAVSVKMMVLQNQRGAAGFFLGSSQSGQALLTPAP